MRGEDNLFKDLGLPSRGSPPHARGRPRCPDDEIRCHGITPACAGKTIAASLSERPPGDHPRMRGEDLSIAPETTWRIGSPPHARGRRRPARRNHPRARITPACAGKTKRAPCTQRRQADHPRMRGEDTDGIRRKTEYMWITPACAGKTAHGAVHCISRPDHPRMRGEDGNLGGR